MGILLKAVARLLWIYSWLTLSLMFAAAAFPAVLWNVWLWKATATWGWPDAVVYFVRTFGVASGYFIAGATLMVLLPILRRVMGWKTGEGTIPIRSWRIWPWYNYNGSILAFQTLFGRFARSSSLYVGFLRAMGAKIGHNVIVNSNTVYDHDLLEIGDNTVIGGDAAIIGHIGEKGHLVRKKVIIGRDCTVGQYTTIFPGAILGDNCHVGAMSLVPKDARLDSNAVYGGVPVRKLKDLKPGEYSSIAQQSDAAVLDVEWEKNGEEEKGRRKPVTVKA